MSDFGWSKMDENFDLKDLQVNNKAFVNAGATRIHFVSCYQNDDQSLCAGTSMNDESVLINLAKIPNNLTICRNCLRIAFTNENPSEKTKKRKHIEKSDIVKENERLAAHKKVLSQTKEDFAEKLQTRMAFSHLADNSSLSDMINSLATELNVIQKTAKEKLNLIVEEIKKPTNSHNFFNTLLTIESLKTLIVSIDQIREFKKQND